MNKADLMSMTAAMMLAATACVSPEQSATDAGTPFIGKQQIEIKDGKLTPEALWAMGRIGSTAVSPDGKQIAYTVSYYSVKENKSHLTIYVMNADGSNNRQLTTTSDNEGEPCWIKGGTKIAFLTAAGGSNQIWEMNPDGTGRKQLSQYEGDIEGFKFSPDESKVLFISQVKYGERTADKYPDLDNVAAICVYPNMAEIVSDTLEADHVNIACVSGGFPSSQTFTEIKVAETAMALHAGANEIDIVISVGKFLSGDYEGMCDEIEELKDVCGDKHLKVILETGALATASNIKKASILSMYSGADFIKTSTGKENPAATPEAALVMCKAIKEYYLETGRKVGFKPAGGINTVHDALVYYTIVKEVLGKEWLTNELFRLGTSRMANLLLSDIVGEEVKFF